MVEKKKIHSLNELIPVRSRLRQEGKKVIFTFPGLDKNDRRLG